MSGPTRAGGPRTLTPPVLGAAAFVMLAALAAVVFVTSRGGLELPVVAPTVPPVAVASPSPSSVSSPEPSAAPSAVSSASPEASTAPAATPAPSLTAGPSGPPDPLAALPACPDHPGCYRYTVRRGDSYTAVSDRFGVGRWIMDALNPEVANKKVIVVGQTLYVGHDPTARLDLCPDGSCHLYVVRSGDTLSAIAARFGLSVARVEARNPGLDPARIVAGQVLRLPLYEAP